MNILKFGRGDFFGITIPGIFLAINIYLLFPKTIHSFFEQQVELKIESIVTLLIPLFFIIGYILGFALRLIKPDILEIFSFLLWFPIILFASLYKFYIKKQIDNKSSFKEYLIYRLKSYWESFPYIDWFYDSFLTKSPCSISLFFNDLLKNEFASNRNTMKDPIFFNQCKLVIQEKSNKLHEEVIFCEGLVRFLSGTSYALIIVMFLILFGDYFNKELFFIYLSILILFVLKLRRIRVKEVVTVFCSLAISLNK